MAEIQCKKCGETHPALEQAPLPGEVGQLLLAGTCKPCWALWMIEQTKLINERSLSPVHPEHYALLVEELKTFLKLEGTGE